MCGGVVGDHGARVLEYATQDHDERDDGDG